MAEPQTVPTCVFCGDRTEAVEIKGAIVSYRCPRHTASRAILWVQAPGEGAGLTAKPKASPQGNERPCDTEAP